MEIAARTRKLRLESSMSSAAVGLGAATELGLLVLLAEQKEVLTWETIEDLAQALNVPLRRFSFDGQPPATPRLTPRLTLQELASLGSRSSTPEPFGTIDAVLKRIKAILAFLRYKR